MQLKTYIILYKGLNIDVAKQTKVGINGKKRYF